MEHCNKIQRSEVWEQIYNVVSKIPRKEVDGDAADAPSVATELEELFLKLLPIHDVSGCFYLQSEKTPADSGEYEVITNRGRVIKIKYKLFEDNGIWECEYGEHEINESVVAWRFLK